MEQTENTTDVLNRMITRSKKRVDLYDKGIREGKMILGLEEGRNLANDLGVLAVLVKRLVPNEDEVITQ